MVRMAPTAGSVPSETRLRKCLEILVLKGARGDAEAFQPGFAAFIGAVNDIADKIAFIGRFVGNRRAALQPVFCIAQILACLGAYGLLVFAMVFESRQADIGRGFLLTHRQQDILRQTRPARCLRGPDRNARSLHRFS